MRIKLTLVVLFVLLFNFPLHAQSPLPAFLDQYTDSMLTQARQPGMIISITRNNEIIYEKALGTADITTSAPMDLTMRFRIGSLTKTFTVTVLLQLVDEGLLTLDDPVSKYFPDIPNAENMTVRMLGDMSSGLHNYSETDEFNASMNATPLRKYKPRELVDMGLRDSVYFPPGTGFHYSNTNTVLAGMLIEQLTKNTLEEEIKTRIIDKLGLTQTTFPSEPEIPGFHPRGYNEDEDKFIEPLTDVTIKYDPSWAWAAGAIISTVADLKIYLKALAEGKLTSEKMHLERQKWALNTPMLKYGVGIFMAGEDFLGHNGSYPGFHNISVHSPSTGITAIIFYNTQSNRNPDDLLKHIVGMLK